MNRRMVLACRVSCGRGWRVGVWDVHARAGEAGLARSERPAVVRHNGQELRQARAHSSLQISSAAAGPLHWSRRITPASVHVAKFRMPAHVVVALSRYDHRARARTMAAGRPAAPPTRRWPRTRAADRGATHTNLASGVARALWPRVFTPQPQAASSAS